MTLPMRTALERQAQALWQLVNPQRWGGLVEHLLQGEYMPPADAAARESQQLIGMLNHAFNHVPFYREHPQWKSVDFAGTDSGAELLLRLPVLTKFDLQDAFDRLKSLNPPPGFEGRFLTSSSGTTGRPRKVLFGEMAFGTYGIYTQRQMRWSRVDPRWKQASIRLSSDIPDVDGRLLKDGETYRSSNWQYLRDWFQTGAFVAFNRNNTVEAQLDWLQQERPDYLVCFPSTLEMLVNAAQGKPVDSLKAVRTFSATLTEGMRQRIESATGLRIDQNYGLNEVGMVAARCESGRYHVHSEHCVVEILDGGGRPVEEGEMGRITVTTLTNPAMPLVRYDTGDLAVATTGECACGRTLPSFGRVIGRFRPFQFTPEGTSTRVDALANTIDHLPLDMMSGLRQTQIHQNLDGSFELRLATMGALDPRLIEVVRSSWDEQFDETTPLRILTVDRIEPAPGGKDQEFSSDFFPSIHEGAQDSASPASPS